MFCLQSKLTGWSNTCFQPRSSRPFTPSTRTLRVRPKSSASWHPRPEFSSGSSLNQRYAFQSYSRTQSSNFTCRTAAVAFSLEHKAFVNGPCHVGNTIWTLKLSNTGPWKYLDGRPLGNSRSCCQKPKPGSVVRMSGKTHSRHSGSWKVWTACRRLVQSGRQEYSPDHV